MAKAVMRHGQVRLDNAWIDYRLHCVPRRKHVHLLVDHDGVLQVRAPYRFSRAGAEAVIREQAPWVVRALRRAWAAPRVQLDTGAEVPYLDEQLTLELIPAARPRVTREGREVKVQSPLHTPEVIRTLLEGWYRHEARSFLPARLQGFGARLGVQPAKVGIRGQRTLWGSCSARGNISVNWRLMHVPLSLVDYVLVHEICHLRHLNHSQAFWDLVATVLPDYRARRRRLRALPPTHML